MIIQETAGPSSAPRTRATRALRQWIASGRFNDGEALPSERELASHLAMSRTTIRAALEEVQRQGLIVSRDGRHRVVRTISDAPPSILASTIAIIGDPACPLQAPQGTDTIVQVTLAHAINRLDLHAMTIAYARCDQGLVELLGKQRPFGLVVAYGAAELPHIQRSLVALREAGLPVVVHGDDPGLATLDRVTSDQEAGAYDLTRWLIAQGRRRIRCFWSFHEEHAWLEERYRGYVRAMAEAGLSAEPAIRSPGLRAKDIVDEDHATLVRSQTGFLIELFAASAPPDALLTSTDDHAYICAGACRMLGREPGRDVLIAGYDARGSSCPASECEPGALAVTVDKDNQAVAEAMVALLRERAQGTLAMAAQRRLVPHRLITPT